MNIFNSIANFVVGVVITGLSAVGIQTPLTPPTLALSVSPIAIQAGESATIAWSSQGADECVSVQLDTNDTTAGSITVSPTQTTTYSVTCSKTQTTSTNNGVWKSVGSDVTDLWCTSNQPSFRNFYTENECPANFTEDGSCSTVNETCAVNSWQTKGGTVGDLGSQQYCNLITDLYRCVPGNASGQGSAASTNVGTRTVFSGDFGDLVAPHLPYRAKLQQDTNENGGPFVVDGFYTNKATADRVCAVLFPGSTNGSFRGDKYKSPKNNTVLIWNGSRWTQHGARNYNNHLRFTFTCVAPSTVAPPLPTSQTKTVTKSVTVTVLGQNSVPPGGGGGGGGQCADGIDNDGDGLVDQNDLGCSSGGSTESPEPQCADGIDNNGNGLVDLQDAAACSGLTDFNEVAPDPVISLEAPQLVQKDTSARLSWGVSQVEAGSCILSGTNGDRWTLSSGSGAVNSSPLAFETIFTLACVDLNGKETSRVVTVKIAPSFIEQ